MCPRGGFKTQREDESCSAVRRVTEALWTHRHRWVAGVQLYSFAVVSYDSLFPAFMFIGDATVGVGTGKSRAELDRPIIVGDGALLLGVGLISHSFALTLGWKSPWRSSRSPQFDIGYARHIALRFLAFGWEGIKRVTPRAFTPHRSQQQVFDHFVEASVLLPAMLLLALPTGGVLPLTCAFYNCGSLAKIFVTDTTAAIDQ
jgi:hypothetical protein